MIQQCLCALSLFVLWPMCYRCDLCDSRTIQYKIGQDTMLLDIPAEDISLLSAPCTKEILIPDALYVSIHIHTATFGGNVGFEYSNDGMASKVYNDSAFLTNQCSGHSTASTYTKPVVKGLQLFNKTDFICIRFVPELNYRSLGYHRYGGRIQIRLRVTYAYCNGNNTVFLTPVSGVTRTRRENYCRPICSATGVISPCLTTSTRPPDTSPDPSTALSSSSHRPQANISSQRNSFATGIISMTTESTKWNYSPSVTNADNHAVTGILSTLLTMKSYQTSNRATSTSKGITLMSARPSSSVTLPKALSTGSVATRTFTEPVHGYPVRLTTDSGISGVKTTKVSSTPIPKENSSSFQTENVPISVDHQSLLPETFDDTTTIVANTDNNRGAESTLSSKPSVSSDPKSSKTFGMKPSSRKHRGLLEGLYVLVGCLVLFVLIASIMYISRTRRRVKVGSCPTENCSDGQKQRFSDTSYMSRWRDNWFVRYHENGPEEEDQCDSEGGTDVIHGEFFHTSNQELHSIHLDSLLKKDGNHRPTYADPWPLIRLDSDFVRNTKNLERLSSNITTDNLSMVKPDLEKKVSKASSDSGIGKKEVNDSDDAKYATGKAASLKEKSNSSRERFRYIKRVNSHLRSRGSYNVHKAQRSASLSNYDKVVQCTVQSDTDNLKSRHDAPGNREHQYHEISEVHPLNFTNGRSRYDNGPARRNRQRNSSSMCSESSITFEEMLKEEIRKTEEANTERPEELETHTKNTTDKTVTDDTDTATDEVILASPEPDAYRDKPVPRPVYSLVNHKPSDSEGRADIKDRAAGTVQFPK